jgi:quercetin dioxygenase-like cupin family protein
MDIHRGKTMRYGFARHSGTVIGLALSTSAVAADDSVAAPPPVVIHHQDVPLYQVYAWERWGNFINVQAGTPGKEIPYDAARLAVKVYTFPTGEIRAIRFGNGVRTHRHINQTDTILYSWQTHRVHFVNDMAMVTEPGDFALHQKGVYHSGEEIRRGGGIDLEFALNYQGVHNDPTAWWSLARDHRVQPAANWVSNGKVMDAIGSAAASAPASAVHYRVRVAELPYYAAREVYLPAGTTLTYRDMDHDRLLFMLSGHATIKTGGKTYGVESEDAARADRGADFVITANDDAKWAEAWVPSLSAH